MIEVTKSEPPFSWPSVPAVDRVMSIPHLVTSIVDFARQDRTTLARLMRTNKNVYRLVGPVLYHTVWLWEENIDSFFWGSFKPCHCAECNARLKEKFGIDHENGCLTEFGKATNKVHYHGKYTNPVPRPPAAEPSTPDSSEKKSKPKKKNNKKKNKKKKTKAKESAAAAYPTPDKSQGEESPPSSPAPLDPKSDKDQAEITLPISKKDLLGYVRVLTLGGHHESACEVHCQHAADHLQNVEVLRIVDTPAMPFRTFGLCENIPGGSCPIVDVLKPRKLVVRNISGSPLPFPALYELDKRTKEVVLVLPTEHQCYGGSQGSGPRGLVNSLLGQFNNASVIRVVFWPEWDDSLAAHPLARKIVSDAQAAELRAHSGQPLFVDDVAHVLHACTKTRRTELWQVHRPRAEIYGVGTLALSHYGKSALVAQYRKEHGGADPDLHTLAKTRVMGLEIGLATPASGGTPILLSSCTDIKWFTLDNYKRKQFAGEISEWD